LSRLENCNPLQLSGLSIYDVSRHVEIAVSSVRPANPHGRKLDRT